MNKKLRLVKIISAAVVLWLVSSACGCTLLPELAYALANPKKADQTLTCSDCAKPIEGSVNYESGRVYQVGDIVNVDGVYITVLGWDEPNIVDVAIFNRSPKAAPVFTLSQMHLRNAISDYTVTPFTSVTLCLDFDENLAPGDFVHGQVGFITAASNMTFVYDMDGSADKEVLFSLGEKPVRQPLQKALIDSVVGESVKAGSIFQVGDIQYTVDKILWPRGNSIAKPMPGGAFVMMDVIAKNIGTSSTPFTPIAQMRIIDETFTKYQLSLLVLGVEKNAYLPQSDSLAPGKSVSGQVGFEIPTTATRLFLFTKDYYDGGLRSYMEIPVPVKPQPTPTATP